MKKIIEKFRKRNRRKSAVRKRITGTTERPRVIVHRTNKHIYGQVIDDQKQLTIAGISDLKFKSKEKPVAVAAKMGEVLGEMAIKKKVTKVVFDRSGYKYHGRVKAFADGLRKAGLDF